MFNNFFPVKAPSIQSTKFGLNVYEKASGKIIHFQPFTYTYMGAATIKASISAVYRMLKNKLENDSTAVTWLML